MDQNAIDRRRPIPRRDVVAYGVGDLGLNFYWQGAGFYLLFFYTDVVGLPNLTAGLIIAAGGLVDAICDPAMGFLADQTKSRFGRYRGYLLFGAPVLALAFALMFWAPLAAPAVFAAAAALGAHLVFRIAYTCVSIPYGSLGAGLSKDGGARTSLAGARMLFGALGGLTVVHLISSLREGMDDAQAFAAAGAIAGLLGAIPVIAAGLTTREREHFGGPAVIPSFCATIRLAAANGPFVILISAMLFITIANIVFVKTVLYLFERILAAPEAGARAITMMTVAPLVALPVWTMIFRRIDKRPGFLAGCVATVASLLLLLFVGESSLSMTTAACVLIACSFAAFAVGFWSILPDTIDYGHLQSGCRLESSLVGFASAVQKLGIAAAGILIGLALDAVDYAAAGVLTAGTASSLRVMIALAPIAFTAFAAAVFLGYPLNAERHRNIVGGLTRVAPSP